MADSIELLDSPKRTSLQLQSAQIRTTLKDFERTFAADNDGRKPGKDDIRSNATIAARYKEYSKIRDVLVGKLSLTALDAPKSPKRKRHSRVDSGVSWTPRKKSHEETPRKGLHPSLMDPYDMPSSVSPNPRFLNAIGPTPNRDGQVLGLFDLLSNTDSGKSTSQTPVSERKRKLDALETVSPQKTFETLIQHTPSQRPSKTPGDILHHVTGTPSSGFETGHRKNRRTPASASKKFMLSQFFATPSAVRYSDFAADLDSISRTPLRDQVLGLTPENKVDSSLGMDVTPAYLKRSTSFKERLLSASSAGKFVKSTSPPGIRTGPPTLRHFRSAARSVSQTLLFTQSDHHSDEEDFDDDLEALREMENDDINVLANDHQLVENAGQSSRIYKKKGQKRTTRRTIMRPVNVKRAAPPRFVAPEDREGKRDDADLTHVEETQFVEQDTALDEAFSDDDLQSLVEADEDDEFDNKGDSVSENESLHNQQLKPSHKQIVSKNGGNDTKSAIMKPGKKAGMINPNAQSHMNFRSLKIRNKNSKATGGGKARFGRRR